MRKQDVPQRLKDQWKPIQLNRLSSSKETKRRRSETGQSSESNVGERGCRCGPRAPQGARRRRDGLDHIVAKSYVIEDDREGWLYQAVSFVGTVRKTTSGTGRRTSQAGSKRGERIHWHMGRRPEDESKKRRKGEKKKGKKAGRDGKKGNGAAIMGANAGQKLEQDRAANGEPAQYQK